MQKYLPTTPLSREVAKTFFTYEKVRKGKWKELKSPKSHYSGSFGCSPGPHALLLSFNLCTDTISHSILGPWYSSCQLSQNLYFKQFLLKQLYILHDYFIIMHATEARLPLLPPFLSSQVSIKKSKENI